MAPTGAPGRLATDFFLRQQRARSTSLWLRGLFALAMVASSLAMTVTILVLGNALLHGMLYPRFERNFWHAAFVSSHSGWVIGALLLGIMLVASARKAWQLRGGGARVAQALGGRQLEEGRGTAAERQLLNVVAEMALAARIAPPQVFVLEDEKSINAFAAGLTPQAAALGITAGALESLDRDELQAVVAHEFSHILNGDMALNTRLVAWLHGLTVVTGFARGLRQRRRARLLTWQLHVYVWIFYVVGSFGAFAGKLLQAAISRRREELADASAVQFTRNPRALKSALVKIEAAEGAGRIHSSGAPDLAHMFFAESRVPVARWMEQLKGAFLATHPPMLHRVRALDPGLTETQHRALVRRERKALLQQDAADKAPVVVAGETLVAPAAAPKLIHEELPELLLGRLGPETRQALMSLLSDTRADTIALQGLFIAALLAPEPARARAQLVQLAPHLGAALTSRVLRDRTRLESLAALGRLPALAALLPALSRLPDRERARLVKIARAFLPQVAPAEVFRFVVCRLVLGQLAASPPDNRLLTLEEAAGSCSLLCTWMASLSGDSAPGAYRAAMNGLLPPARRPEPDLSALSIASIDAALAEVLRTPHLVKRELIAALVRALGADQSLAAPEFDLLRFLCMRLGVAIPPVPLTIRSAEAAA